MTEHRFAVLAALEKEAHEILDEAIRCQIAEQDREVAGVVILFSGGNDSTVLAHLFKDRATYAAHANTGIGIEATRKFVRDTCGVWNLPLIEKHVEPGATYRDLVLGKTVARTGPNKGKQIYSGGFPGPAMHWLMYQRLKERSMEKVRNDLINNPRKQRVVFLAGRRASESKRRTARYKDASPYERKGSVVWVSPLVNWTKMDMNTYRVVHPDVPRNEVANLLHMSGECLCGAFAHHDELEEIGYWFPDMAAEIHDLENEVSALGTIPAERCRWGWGAGKEKPSGVGPLCSSCEFRFQADDVMAAVRSAWKT